MPISQRLLILVSFLAILHYGMPQTGSNIGSGPAISKRDDLSNYAVYGKNFTDRDQTLAIWNLLKDIVFDEKNLTGHGGDIGMAFWSLPMTDDDAKTIRVDAKIGAVVKECTEDCPNPTDFDDQDTENNKARRSWGSTAFKEGKLFKRDDGLVNSHKVLSEMVFVSLPRDKVVEDYEDFVYDKSAGSDVMLYIVDSGAGLSNNDEFSSYVRPNVQWLRATGKSPPNNDENDSMGAGHGTGVLAKAAGWKHGIAKRSNPVVVRVNKYGDPAEWLDGVVQAYNDWLSYHYIGNTKTATGVLNLSWGWTNEALKSAGYSEAEQRYWRTRLISYLNGCIAIGLLPIAASGNTPRSGPPNLPVDQYPQLFAYESPEGYPAEVPNMMVVGGIGTDGALSRGSSVDPPNRGDVIKVYAPSQELTVPNAITGNYREGEASGISLACGTVSGLGAYFLGLSSLSTTLHDDNPVKRVQKLKELLQTGSCISRTEDDSICGLNNLADPRKCPPDVPDDFEDGDEIDCKSETLNPISGHPPPIRRHAF